MKEMWFELYVEKLDELADSGMDERQANDIATRYADNRLPDFIADLADYKRQSEKE